MSVKQDLENFELLIEHRLKNHSRYWLIGAIVALVIVVMLFITLFRNKPTNETYKGQINTLDSLVKYQAGKIETLERYNELLDSNIQTLNEKYKANRPIETRIIHEYERIPVTVRDLNREQLRNEVSNY